MRRAGKRCWEETKLPPRVLSFVVASFFFSGEELPPGPLLPLYPLEEVGHACVELVEIFVIYIFFLEEAAAARRRRKRRSSFLFFFAAAAVVFESGGSSGERQQRRLLSLLFLLLFTPSVVIVVLFFHYAQSLHGRVPRLGEEVVLRRVWK